ncbi:uncharacterized protein LOC108733911 isoform X1 [Agrilus planipennis]|uniref:Uncharacterized protein LOC108733911 isoform X1 n=1 Tax=Agrilus planipennis TaxID=224129 RepID=A0A1W4W9Q8_AGRPL|nr:uncharacterized protein LOC108733911 isoform X1 [Agrilus planipennis]
MKVITAFLLLLVPGNHTKPLRVSLQQFLQPRNYGNVNDNSLYDPVFPLSKPVNDESNPYNLDDFLRNMPPALKDTYLIKLKETQLSLQDMSENFRNVGDSKRLQRKAFSKKDKRYVNSSKRILQNNGRANEERNLTLCHFKICNMGRKRTTQLLHVVSEDKEG